MSLRIRLLVLTGLLSVAAAGSASAQRGTIRSRPETVRIKRPAYGYFKYRIPGQSLRITPRVELQHRALDRSMERQQQALDRQFALRERLRERTLSLQDRAWRRQLEARERAMERVKDRMNRMTKQRPFGSRRHWRTI